MHPTQFASSDLDQEPAPQPLRPIHAMQVYLHLLRHRAGGHQPVPGPPGTQFNRRKKISSNFGLENHSSIGLKFPTQRKKLYRVGQLVGDMDWVDYGLWLNTAQLLIHFCQFPNSPIRTRLRVEHSKSKSTQPIARPHAPHYSAQAAGREAEISKHFDITVVLGEVWLIC